MLTISCVFPHESHFLFLQCNLWVMIKAPKAIYCVCNTLRNALPIINTKLLRSVFGLFYHFVTA